MSNDVQFNLELAVQGFKKNLDSIDNQFKSFNSDFQKQAAKSSGAFSSFVGNLSANAVSAAVSGLFNLVGAMKDFTKESIFAAVEAQETASKFDAVFSLVSDKSEAMAKDLQKNYGLGITESKSLLSATGDLLSGFGFTQESALDLSSQVQKLSVDLASFTNFAGGAEGASEAITKALLGERESVKALGVSIQEKAVLEQVAINNAKGLTFETEQQAKAQATLDLIIKQSGNAIGDYAKTSLGAANQLKLFNTRMEDLSIQFGENFLPILEPVIREVNNFISSLDQNKINEFVQNGLVNIAQGLIIVVQNINPVITAVKNMGSVFNIIQNGITSGLATVGLVLAGAASGWIQIFRSLISSLPASLIPDGWVEGLDSASEALDATMKGMVESISEDSNDMSESLNSILNPENTLSEDQISEFEGKLTRIKEGIISNKNAIDADEIARQKKQDADRKKREIAEKKIQDDQAKAEKKVVDFKKTLFGEYVKWEDASGDQRAKNFKDTLGTIATLSSSSNKTLFAIGKAAAISTATIDGFAAVQKALASAPPPFNFALAGLVGVATAANIANIASAKAPSAGNFANGGFIGGSSFTGDNMTANVNSGEAILNNRQQNEFMRLANGTGGNNDALIERLDRLENAIMNRPIVLVADDNEIARSTSRGVANGISIGNSR